MRWTDILGLPVSSLWQQKSRTVLTTLGVVFGSFVLAASLSIGQGVQNTIERESRRTDFLRKIDIRAGGSSPSAPGRAGTGRDARNSPPPEDVPLSGEMSDAKRERLLKIENERKARNRANSPRTLLTRAQLATLGAIPHVEAVVPVLQNHGSATFEGRSPQTTEVACVRPEDPSCRQHVVAGRFFDNPAEQGVVVSEHLLYRWGITDDDSVQKAIGKKIKIEFRSDRREPGLGIVVARTDGGEMLPEERAALDKMKKQLPALIGNLDLSLVEKGILLGALQGRPAETGDKFTEEFPVIGVLRTPTAQEQQPRRDPLRVEADILLPFQAATDLFFRIPGRGERGVGQAVVVVDREEHAKEVLQRVSDLGFNAHALLEFIERQRLIYLLIFGGMTCVAAVALLVAALGIANTMLMSVLERTREIGIMKAVGASNGQLQSIFLIEGALIGACGGICGLLLAWGASFPGDAWVRAMVLRDIKIELKETLFAFPPGLAMLVLLFAVLVTTLAAVYPARRAAKVDPVTALRHE